MVRTLYDYALALANIDSTTCCCFTYTLSVLWKHLKLPRVRHSKVTRLRYVFTLLIVSFLALSMLTTKSWRFLSKQVCQRIGFYRCELVHGVGPVYRIFFALAFLFFVMALLMIGVIDTDKSTRSLLHNRFWMAKFAIVAGVLFGSIFFPRSIYTGEVWHFFGLNSGFAFLIVQFVLLIDAVHLMNANVVRWMDDSPRKCSFLILWLPTSVLYVLTIYATVTFYRTYSSRTDCISNLFFISFHVYMCVAATFISIHPIIQEARPKCGLLQSSVACAYSTFVMWVALSNQPDELCNPHRQYLYPLDPLNNAQIGCSLFISFAILLIFSTRIVQPPQYGRCIVEPFASEQQDQEDTVMRIAYDDETQGVQYSYSMFHTVLCLCSFYCMMILTNWYRPEEEENLSVKLIAGWGAIWMKLCSGIFCVFIYIWSMVAPLIFPNTYRDLAFYDFFFTIY